ncbi:hypothetical protein [Rhodopseudomonas sp. B29]|uniref:hypothetical protein n=1 Tax=Rhodopseudomonas sp. B29 TaxID=95607 RepID=UPI00034B89EC|nr:hypothetical protein [Rhodopseudomonas sp. B29]
MSEAEYNLMLAAVSAAMATGSQDNLPRPGAVRTLRCAANDNQVEWPLLPFPSDWSGAC